MKQILLSLRALGAACLLVLPLTAPTAAVAQVRHGSGEYRRPPQVQPSTRPAYRPGAGAHRPRPGLGRPPGVAHRPGIGRPPPQYHRPGWGSGRPVPVYPQHHHHHYRNDDDGRSSLGAAIVGGLVAGAVVGIITNGLQENNGPAVK